jgi:hypothetical protein
VEFSAFDAAQMAGTSQIPSNLIAKPLLNLYFVSCEVNTSGYRLLLYLIHHALGFRVVQKRNSKAN